MTVPEYRPDATSRIYPMPEPHKAGKDMSECRHTILTTALDMYRAKSDEADIYSEALDDLWRRVRQLQDELAAKDEQIATLREFAGERVERQTRERELGRVS